MEPSTAPEARYSGGPCSLKRKRCSAVRQSLKSLRWSMGSTHTCDAITTSVAVAVRSSAGASNALARGVKAGPTSNSTSEVICTPAKVSGTTTSPHPMSAAGSVPSPWSQSGIQSLLAEPATARRFCSSAGATALGVVGTTIGRSASDDEVTMRT